MLPFSDKLKILWAANFWLLLLEPVYASQNGPVLHQHFSRWSLRCIYLNAETNKIDVTTPSKVPSQCEIAQTIKAETEGETADVLRLALSQTSGPKRDWLLVAVTPLDVMIPSGIGLTVQSMSPIKAPYRNCNLMGCFAFLSLNKGQLAGFAKASEGAVSYRRIDGRDIKILISFEGLSEAIRSLPELPVLEKAPKANGKGAQP